MSRHLLVLLFLYGLNNVSGASQETSGDVAKTRIKKNVGANGLEPQTEIFQNFRNPVLEYLMRDNVEGVRKRGVVREIRHSQSLLVPNFFNIPGSLMNALPQLQGGKKPETGTRNPASPVANFWDFVKNPKEENKSQDSIVTSQVVQLNKNSTEEKEERTTVQVYPALAVAVNTFNKDGSVKKSVVHFQPDFTSLARGSNAKEATPGGSTNNRVSNYINGQKPETEVGDTDRQQPSIPWPFAGVFPIVINDPFLSAYNAFSTSMYNAVSSMIEYGPDADICRHKKPETEFQKSEKYENEENTNSDIFDEVTMRSETFKKANRKANSSLRDRLIISDVAAPSRRRRDATSIHLKSRQGDKVSISLEEPVNLNEISANAVDERARSFNPVLVNTPPLSTILKPPHSESRQFLGYADKKRKTKPSKPIKEEGSSEEVGEEHEEENTSQSPESANEAVAISPPPEGASVAEAKPIGLAIAGPGGVAASKPQGTAVAGPGGLAIARPVGTAIAGVDVEGSVPIGGQQKNKKKPKQEQTETELHYVGGLTGPIGNPQPKEFADGVTAKYTRDAEGNIIQESLLFRSRQGPQGYQLKLGQQDGKYGFVPMFASPVQGSDTLEKRMDNPTFFHGMLGNNPQFNDQYQNYQIQF